MEDVKPTIKYRNIKKDKFLNVVYVEKSMLPFIGSI